MLNRTLFLKVFTFLGRYWDYNVPKETFIRGWEGTDNWNGPCRSVTSARLVDIRMLAELSSKGFCNVTMRKETQEVVKSVTRPSFGTKVSHADNARTHRASVIIEYHGLWLVGWIEDLRIRDLYVRERGKRVKDGRRWTWVHYFTFLTVIWFFTGLDVSHRYTRPRIKVTSERIMSTAFGNPRRSPIWY